MAAPVFEMFPDGQSPDAEAANVVDIHRGQLRFAERFTKAYAEKFLHAHGIGWHAWVDVRWELCTDGGETRAVIALVKDALGDLAVLDGDARKDLYKDIAKMETAPGINGVLDLAGKMRPCTVSADRLDENRSLVNTQSGTVDLDTGKLRPTEPADRLTKVTRAKFDTAATSAEFTAFLKKIQPSAAMREYLARSLGSALLGSVREQKLFIWHGEGANGKGTLRDVIRHALGEYAIEIPAEVLLASKYGHAAMAPERMRLRGARFAFCSEIDEGARMDAATMKKLTGGDPVNAKLLYRNPIEFDPSHQLFMLTNHLPVVSGDDPAVWRRIEAVPFAVTVPADQRDPDLAEKLKANPEAALAWIWGGWLDYCAQGLNPPAEVIAATKKYQQDSDLLARFLDDDNGLVIHMGKVKSADLFKAFSDWVRAEGEEVTATNKRFTEQMEKSGFTRKRESSGQWWQGISLAARDDDGD